MGLQTLRPDSTIDAGTWVPSGAATLWQATNDDSDATFAAATVGNASRMALGLTNYTLAAGERVKQLRVRDRGRIDLQRPALSEARINGVTYSATPTWFDGTFTNHNGDWGQTPFLVTQLHINVAQYHGIKPVAVGTPDIAEGYVDLDVRSVIVASSLQVLDGAGVDRCGGTVTDTNLPLFPLDTTYGYAGAPGGNLIHRIQRRVFTQAQTADPDFDPWIDGPWGPPVFDNTGDAANGNQQGTTVSHPGTSAQAAMDPLTNDTYEVFARAGTLDFQAQTGEPWWGNTLSCTFTVNVPTPDPPTIDCTTAPLGPSACPPQVDVEVCHDPSAGTAWDDPALVRGELQKSIDGGTTWALVDSDPANGTLIPESSCVTFTDRFVTRHTDIEYRARLYGFSGGVVLFTDWVQCGPVTVAACECTPRSRCRDGSIQTVCHGCDTWLIHPANSALDWTGKGTDDPFTRTRPYAPSQPIVGGLPTVPSGFPGGRDHQLTVFPVGTLDALALADTLEVALVWYVPADPLLPAVWLAPGPSTSWAVSKGPDVWTVGIPTIQVQGQPVVLPEAES